MSSEDESNPGSILLTVFRALPVAGDIDHRNYLLDNLVEEIERLALQSHAVKYSKFLNELSRYLFELSVSPDPKDKFIAVFVICMHVSSNFFFTIWKLGHLIENAQVDLNSLFPIFLNYINEVIPSRDSSLNTMAGKAITVLIERSSPEFRKEIAKYETDNLIKLLKGDSDRTAAREILAQLLHSSTAIQYLLPQSASLMVAFLESLVRCPQGELKKMLETFYLSLEQLNKGLREKKNSENFKLLLQGLLENLDNVPGEGFFTGIKRISIMFPDIISDPMIFDATSHYALNALVDGLISNSAIDLMPVLVKSNPNYFADKLLQNWFDLNLKILSGRCRFFHTIILEKLGEVIEILGKLFYPYMARLVPTLRALLKPSIEYPEGDYTAFFQRKKAIYKFLETIATDSHFETLAIFLALLPSLLEQELTKEHFESITKFISYSAGLSCYFEDYIYRNCQRILNQGITMQLSTNNQEKIIFACHVLKEFPFSQPILHCQLGSQLEQLLSPQFDTEIRMAALSSIVCLLTRRGTSIENNDMLLESFTTTSKAVTHLLHIAATDKVALVTLAILNALNSQRFDFYLSSFEHIHWLLVIMSTGAPSCRLISARILGRISKKNSGLLLPHMRHIVFQSLAAITCEVDDDLLMGSTSLISEVMGFNTDMMAPLAEPLVRAIAPFLKAGNRVPSVIFDALAFLIPMNPMVFESYATELLDLSMNHLNDQSMTKKRLSTLPMLCSLISTLRKRAPFERLSALLLEVAELLKIEQVGEVRMEAIRLLGLIGALDPYRLRSREVELLQSSSHEIVVTGTNEDITDDEIVKMPAGPASRGDEFYTEIVLRSLLKMVKDPSLYDIHGKCAQAVIEIVESTGTRSSLYLDEIIPVFLKLLKKEVEDNGGLCNAFIDAITATIHIAGVHIRPFSEEIIETIHSIWVSNSSFHLPILKVVDAIAQALHGETSEGIKSFTPLLLSMHPILSDIDLLSQQVRTMRVSLCYAKHLMHQFIHLIDNMVKLLPIEQLKENIGLEILLFAFEVTRRPSSEHQLILIVNWCRKFLSLPLQDHDLLLRRLIGIIDKLLTRIFLNCGYDLKFLWREIGSIRLPTLTQAIRCNEDKEKCLEIGTTIDSLDLVGFQTILTTHQASPNEQNCGLGEDIIKKAWVCNDLRSKESWFSWMRSVELQLLRFSPSRALRSCATIAESFYPLARELFNAAFAAYWIHLSELCQDEIASAFESALSSETIPSEIMQLLLNLAEFMERNGQPLPIDSGTLSAFSMKCHAFAKALYYQEIEFSNSPNTRNVEALISISSQLGHPDSAEGALIYAESAYNIILEESWLEKLQRWEEAFKAYQVKLEEQSDNHDALLGMLRCWHALGDWDSLIAATTESWEALPAVYQNAVLPLAASAAWSAGRWDKMDTYVQNMQNGTPENALFRAVLAIKHQKYEEANSFIRSTREMLDTELTAMLSESYERAYNTIVRAQSLSELEEVISYCLSSRDTSMRFRTIECWNLRLNDCKPNVDVWQRVLKIRSLVLSAEDSLEHWIKFATMCRRSGRPALAYRTLLMLMKIDSHGEGLDDYKFVGTADLTQSAPQVVYGFLKHNWEIGERELAVKYLFQYTRYLASTLDKRLSDTFDSFPISSTRLNFDIAAHSKLLARCYLKLGEWQKFLAWERGEEVEPSEMDAYLAATSYDKNSYKAWRGWALVNFEMAAEIEKRYARTSSIGRSMIKNPYLVPAIQGLFRAIGLSQGSSLQDLLRLLTLWFKYGTMPEVHAAIGDGFSTVPIENWLQVIPQLIARIHVPSPQIRRLVHHLLAEIGKLHPQALIYPLTVASKSQSVSRRTSALAILDKMRSHSARLVEQAVLISQELIRIAILWEEMWYEALEEASRLYYCERNYAAMSAILDPLYQLLDRGADTAAEKGFVEQYGRELKEAREHCFRYKRSNDTHELDQSWDMYHQVFRRIAKHLPQIGPISLSNVSPKLLNARDMEIAVPGCYKPGGEVVRILSFYPTVGVISSKQRPRKLVIAGSDGRRYKYLLKGHEDLRQDERVMQLFGLINALLASSNETRKRHLSIQRFSVVPLSQNTGLISWVPHCDTMHSLIREYRESHGILLSLEHRVMVQFAPDYERLQLINKIEAFENGQLQTDGRDLAKIMWIRSGNAEVWLDRRITFTRSLAVISMVGYILGLGDRHPSNLMIEQLTGRVVHIDFGDCFEVAMQREKFPEKVPFRLTRMLIRAMEISGIEGSYRITCEIAMKVLRDNKDSLMAVLEAFVYDPLINWRLLTKNEVNLPPGISFSSLEAIDGDHLGAQVSYTKASGIGRDTIKERQVFPMDFSSSRRIRRDVEISRLEDESINRPEAVNAGALNVMSRISKKLTGKDFSDGVRRDSEASLDVHEQVDKVIKEAIRVENLCQSYVGWCAFW